MENCFWCYMIVFQETTLYLHLYVLENAKRTVIYNLSTCTCTLKKVEYFCPLKTEIAQFLIKFCLNIGTDGIN